MWTSGSGKWDNLLHFTMGFDDVSWEEHLPADHVLHWDRSTLICLVLSFSSSLASLDCSNPMSYEILCEILVPCPTKSLFALVLLCGITSSYIALWTNCVPTFWCQSLWPITCSLQMGQMHPCSPFCMSFTPVHTVPFSASIYCIYQPSVISFSLQS